MATHDYVIDNQTSASARADINSVLQAIVTNNSSATAPTQTYGNMFWYDTANNFLKMRNEADSEWVIIGYIDQATGQFDVRTDVIQAVTAGGTVVKNSSGAIVLNLKPASQVTAEAGTNNTEIMTPLRVKQSITENAPSAGWEFISSLTGVTTANMSTQFATGCNIYRTLKVMYILSENGNANLEIQAAETSTFRTIVDFICGDGADTTGSKTIHNSNNAESIIVKPADVSGNEIRYDDEGSSSTTNLSGVEVFNFNEVWNVLRVTSQYAGTDYEIYAFGMR